jgi:hypothetical protein
VEGVAARQTAHVVVVLQCVETDGAGVAGCGEHFWWRSGANWIVLVFFINGNDRCVAVDVGRRGLCVVFDADALRVGNLRMLLWSRLLRRRCAFSCIQ